LLSGLSDVERLLCDMTISVKKSGRYLLVDEAMVELGDWVPFIVEKDPMILCRSSVDVPL
jgi:hypothetical protein